MGFCLGTLYWLHMGSPMGPHGEHRRERPMGKTTGYPAGNTPLGPHGDPLRNSSWTPWLLPADPPMGNFAGSCLATHRGFQLETFSLYYRVETPWDQFWGPTLGTPIVLMSGTIFSDHVADLLWFRYEDTARNSPGNKRRGSACLPLCVTTYGTPRRETLGTLCVSMLDAPF
jgi:hypothetical protein